MEIIALLTIIIAVLGLFVWLFLVAKMIFEIIFTNKHRDEIEYVAATNPFCKFIDRANLKLENIIKKLENFSKKS